jgi:hypothetical protein
MSQSEMERERMSRHDEMNPSDSCARRTTWLHISYPGPSCDRHLLRSFDQQRLLEWQASRQGGGVEPQTPHGPKLR